MEEQEQKNKECFLCGNFQSYYIKRQFRFQKTQVGYCIQKREIIDKHETCPYWNSHCRKFYSSKKRSIKVLSELLFEIAAIRQVLQSEEEQGEKK